MRGRALLRDLNTESLAPCSIFVLICVTMGTRVPKTISDLATFGLDVGISCDDCGRIAVFKPSDVDAFFNRRNIPRTLPINTALFTCKCGSRNSRSIAVEVIKRPTPAEAYGLQLNPMYIIRPPKDR